MNASLEAWHIVHDFAFVFAGAERTTQAIAETVLPGSPIVAIAGRERVLSRMSTKAGSRLLLPSRLINERTFRSLTPAYPTLCDRLSPLRGNMLASSYAFAMHVPCTGAKIVYCHSPLRQVWSGAARYSLEGQRLERASVRLFGDYLRRRDLEAAGTVDLFIAASNEVRSRIRRYYGREAEVIHPPVDVAGTFVPDWSTPRQDFYLWVGRIAEPYKKLEMTIDAFRGLQQRLVVVGDGRDRSRLQAGAPSNVRFVGWQSGERLADLYRQARALVFPSEDDFGMVPVEAMGCGTPSIAYHAGGALETVVEGVTGIFFDEQSPAALRQAIAAADKMDWDHQAIVGEAQKYSKDSFAGSMSRCVNNLMTE